MGIVRTRRAIALLIGALFLVGFGPVREIADAAGQAAEPTAPVRVANARDELLALTNADRASRGRVALSLADSLSRYAERHSRRMARLGTLFHSGDDQLTEALEGTGWSVAGENVGVGDSLRGVQDAFMASAPHRRNILAGDYDHAAIGVVEADGVVWITVVFYGD